jgi:hypothetical protein
MHLGITVAWLRITTCNAKPGSILRNTEQSLGSKCCQALVQREQGRGSGFMEGDNY